MRLEPDRGGPYVASEEAGNLAFCQTLVFIEIFFANKFSCQIRPVNFCVA